MLLPRYSDITHGLTQRPARISPKYFYDQHGSQLFEAITRLPEYYPTRTEMALMQAHADSIAHAIGPGRTLIELGAGNCQKARTLCRLVQPACFVGVDISADFLEQAVQGLRDEFPALDARALAGDMTLGVSLPDDIPRTGRLVFYPGSSIGNFDPPHALDLLAHMRELVGDDGGLLIGVDRAHALQTHLVNGLEGVAFAAGAADLFIIIKALALPCRGLGRLGNGQCYVGLDGPQLAVQVGEGDDLCVRQKALILLIQGVFLKAGRAVFAVAGLLIQGTQAEGRLFGGGKAVEFDLHNIPTSLIRYKFYYTLVQ